MIKELRPWLKDNVFEENDTVIYLQRPFVNPAGSPFENGKEIGLSGWHTDDKCSERRSLIEEAQEVKAKGRPNLSDLRKDVTLRSSLPPTRNILIAHSMGGVASREYVQGDFYKNDVDKVITLDSPHEGTQSLSMLISKHEDWGLNLFSLGTQFLGTGGVLASFGDDLFINYYAILLWTIGVSYGLSEVLDIFYLRPTFPYTSDDPLAYYIDPDNMRFKKKNEKTIKDLNAIKYDMDKQTPMFRLLYSTKALTFTDPKNSFAKKMINGFIPEALFVSTVNFYSQIQSDNPMNLKINSAFASMYMGALLGFGLEDNGSSLIPSWSGSAKNTSFFNDMNVDVKKVPYDAAFNSGNITGFASIIETATIAMIAAEVALSWSPQLKLAAKLGLMTSASLYALPLIAATIAPFVADFDPSHRAPTMSKYQSQWKSSPNAYSKILGGSESYTPYQMEEFLYEKPFVNLRVNSVFNSDWEDENKDTLGLYGYDSVTGKYVSLGVTANFTNPLSFKSNSDWEQMGAKKERWETTTGVGSSKIPIRHADRYPMPAFMVKNFIERYEFEVDDLMPHRLRQIRMNFNFNEDIAWECDVNKAETDPSACKVYKRTSNGEGWTYVKETAHPVQKNGLFAFKPREYYDSSGLGTIQKDNQNVVTISTVNKIGLANSQRFYYMFKATADLLEPVWPLRNIKISSIKDFTAYVSTLAYQNISAIGGEECVLRDDNYSPPCQTQYNLSTPSRYGNGYHLKSLHTYGDSIEGNYIWKLKINTGDISDASKSSVSDMIVPFVLDKTPPAIELAAESDVVNPDSVSLLARFKTNEPLSFAAFFLKNTSGATIAVAKYSDIIAPNFGIWLSKFKDVSSYKDIENLPDGKYEITAYAFDGSVASKEQREILSKVAIDSISVFDLFSNGTFKHIGMNFGKDTTAIIVDSRAPEFNIALSGLVMNKDSLLKIKLNVSDINGKAAASARFSIMFADTSGADTLRIGDTLLLKNGIGGKTWTEQETMLIPDGDYEVFASVWDEAGNMSQKKYSGILRVDRLPPTITGLFSPQMVYRDSTGNYTAELHAKQSDKANHLSGLRCSYRINGKAWQSIPDTLKKQAENQILAFEMDKNVVGSTHGLRYLEAGCRDWAGNFASDLDFFFVGTPLPAIIYPVDTWSGDSVIVVRGVAPTLSSSDLPASYMLEWRKEGDALWQTKGVDIGYGKRYSDFTPYISNLVLSSPGDLGFLLFGSHEYFQGFPALCGICQ
ncbi:hypothetical protein R83H12_01557 [Fibrobacteria bacterium R8-3-H12]